MTSSVFLALSSGYEILEALAALADGPRRPILECSPEGRWVQTRAVDIREYLDPAWDEALNTMGSNRKRLPQAGSIA